jgi:Pyruvate/2-oxoacid:ferredoxin oxidoreductase delta subunit
VRPRHDPTTCGASPFSGSDLPKAKRPACGGTALGQPTGGGMRSDEGGRNTAIDPSTSLRVDPERSRGIDRRTFLKWMPREVRQLMTAISSARSTSLRAESAVESSASTGAQHSIPSEVEGSRDSASVTVARDGGPESRRPFDSPASGGVAQGRPERAKRVEGRGVATIDIARCLAWEASECQLCYLRCPLRDEAIVLDGGKPTIVAQACDGCGVCVEACRAVNDLGAIHIVNV